MSCGHRLAPTEPGGETAGAFFTGIGVLPKIMRTSIRCVSKSHLIEVHVACKELDKPILFVLLHHFILTSAPLIILSTCAPLSHRGYVGADFPPLISHIT